MNVGDRVRFVAKQTRGSWRGSVDEVKLNGYLVVAWDDRPFEPRISYHPDSLCLVDPPLEVLAARHVAKQERHAVRRRRSS